MFKDALARRRRRRHQAQATTPGMQAFLLDDGRPRSTPVDEVSFLAVDVETTGLDPRTDALLSIGYVPVEAGRIELAGARSFVLRAEGTGVGQSAVIHGLTDDTLAQGADPAEVLDEFFGALAGRVMLAHYAEMEVGFLGELARRIWGFAPDLQVVDTMRLQADIVAPGFDDEPQRDQLRLWAAREHFGLPEAGAHDALGDALACAELFLAQSRELGRRGAETLGALMR